MDVIKHYWVLFNGIAELRHSLKPHAHSVENNDKLYTKIILFGLLLWLLHGLRSEAFTQKNNQRKLYQFYPNKLH